MSRAEFHEEAARQWEEAIATAIGGRPPMVASPGGFSPPQSYTWYSPTAMIGVLQPFAQSTNHLLFSDGGGHDVIGVTYGSEPNTLRFKVTEKLGYQGAVSSVTLEYFPDAPIESFLVIDLAPLAPSGVYPDLQSKHEELVEVPGEGFGERSRWDYEDLPAGSKRTVRMLGGRQLFVSKGSLWNSNPRTYSGEHDRLTNQQIRELITEWQSQAEGN